MKNKHNRNPIKELAQKYSGNHPIIYLINDGIEKNYNKLVKRHKVQNEPAHLSCNPFFIIGSGRSGNTLLRSILFKNPDITIPPESFVLSKAIRRYRQLSWLDWKELCGVVISVFKGDKKLERWGIDLLHVLEKAYALEKEQRTLANILDELYCYYGKVHKPGFKRWGDKTPINTFSLELIDSVYPDCQFIHLVRDGRDVVNSYMKAGFYQTASEASSRWKTSINTAVKFGGRIANHRFLEVKYEDLVQSPEETTKLVCNYLNIEYTDEMMNHFDNVTSLGDSYLNHHQNLKKPINTSSIGKGERELNPKDLKTVNKICKKELSHFSYINVPD